MAAHMMLLERFPAFRVNQMRLEAVTSRQRDTQLDLRKSRLVTIKTAVHVVHSTDEQNISMAQIRSQIAALNKDYRHGVGRFGAHDKTSGTPVKNFTRNNKVYRLNDESDRDKDGIACEKR